MCSIKKKKIFKIKFLKLLAANELSLAMEDGHLLGGR